MPTNSRRKRIFMCFGTRAEAIKMCPLYLALVRERELDLKLITSGQHAELALDVMRFFGVRADVTLNVMKKGQTPEYVRDEVRRLISPILKEGGASLLLVQGDTATALGAALGARDAGVPIAHVEAGMRSGDDSSPYPEEIYRKRISELAAYHFAPTEKERDNLLSEGASPAQVFVCGNTIIDSLNIAAQREADASALVREIDFSYPTILLTVHRRENIKKGIDEIFSAAKSLLEKRSDVQILLPIHKNEEVRRLFSEAGITSSRMITCEPLDYPSFVYAMKRCRFIISDSGGVCEEASYLGIPLMIVRTVTERPQATEYGSALLCRPEREIVYSTALELCGDSPLYRTLKSRSFSFGDGNACSRITDIIRGL